MLGTPPRRHRHPQPLYCSQQKPCVRPPALSAQESLLCCCARRSGPSKPGPHQPASCARQQLVTSSSPSGPHSLSRPMLSPRLGSAHRVSVRPGGTTGHGAWGLLLRCFCTWASGNSDSDLCPGKPAKPLLISVLGVDFQILVDVVSSADNTLRVFHYNLRCASSSSCGPWAARAGGAGGAPRVGLLAPALEGDTDTRDPRLQCCPRF